MVQGTSNSILERIQTWTHIQKTQIHSKFKYCSAQKVIIAVITTTTTTFVKTYLTMWLNVSSE